MCVHKFSYTFKNWHIFWESIHRLKSIPGFGYTYLTTQHRKLAVKRLSVCNIHIWCVHCSSNNENVSWWSNILHFSTANSSFYPYFSRSSRVYNPRLGLAIWNSLDTELRVYKRYNMRFLGALNIYNVFTCQRTW